MKIHSLLQIMAMLVILQNSSDTSLAFAKGGSKGGGGGKSGGGSSSTSKQATHDGGSSSSSSTKGPGSKTTRIVPWFIIVATSDGSEITAGKCPIELCVTEYRCGT